MPREISEHLGASIAVGAARWGSLSLWAPHYLEVQGKYGNQSNGGRWARRHQGDKKENQMGQWRCQARDRTHQPELEDEASRSWVRDVQFPCSVKSSCRPNRNAGGTHFLLAFLGPSLQDLQAKSLLGSRAEKLAQGWRAAAAPKAIPDFHPLRAPVPHSSLPDGTIPSFLLQSS